LFEESELQNSEHRFTVALPMQIRYGALGALTNTIEWAAHFFQQSWNNTQSPLPKEFRNNPEITALKLLEHFDVLMSLNKATVVTDYRNLVVVRNAVVHIGGIVRDLPKQKRAELQKAVESLKGFRIANWHFLGECVEIDRDALDPYIDSMGQLLFEIYKTADEKRLLRVLTACGRSSTSK
jgi:hypothetical protein